MSNARRLVEQDKVFALFNTLGTPNNLAIWDYTNQQKVPHLFVATGASDWGEDIDKHPYTIGWQPDYVSEANAYAEFLKKEKPNAKVAVLYQNDGFGKDLLGGFEKAIEGSDIKIVARESYEVTDPTVAPQVAKLAASGADTFLNITTPKPSAQAIAAVAKSDWRPLHILNNVGASKTLVLKPVGLEAAQGIVSTTYFKDPEDSQWADDPAMTGVQGAAQEVRAEGSTRTSRSTPTAGPRRRRWSRRSTGDEGPDREALMGRVRNMDAEIPLLLPGIKVQDGRGRRLPDPEHADHAVQGRELGAQGEVIKAGV